MTLVGAAGLLVSMPDLAGSTATAQEPAIDAGTVAWSRLEFRPPSRPDDLSAEVSLSETSPEQLATLLYSGPGMVSVFPPEAPVLQMSSSINVFVTGRAYQTDVLFLPAGLSPLQRLRDKTGRGANRKIFRYLADGVRRWRIEPDGRAEARQPPTDWTAIREHFYPFGAALTDCPVLTDPSLLLFLASAEVVTEAAEPLALCVFNKKTIYRARLASESAGSSKADYLEIIGATRKQVRRNTRIRTVRIEASPSKTDEIDPDPFELFEMTGEIEIDLDVDSGLPMRIGGDISGYGRVELLLSEVEWRR